MKTLKKNITIEELFEYYEDNKAIRVAEYVNSCFEYNEAEFDHEAAIELVEELAEELAEISFDCNKINFLCDNLGRDCYAYDMGLLDEIMDGWKPSQVVQYCNHRDFDEGQQWFYFSDVYELAYSTDDLEEVSPDYETLNKFIIDTQGEINEFLEMWSEENIENAARLEAIAEEIGNVYLY